MALLFERRGAELRAIVASTLFAGLFTLAATTAPQAADISVVLDQARLLKLADRVATVVIGNPAIADATIQGGNLLIITGKGKAVGPESERGVLRRQVPHWLSLPEFRSLVVGFEEAHIGHGGEGALYVRIRRSRG